MKNNSPKKAFTLAEVLVTLMIIGVIASVTIPALRKSSDEQTYVVSAKKAFNTLLNATESLKETDGPMSLWDINEENILKMYKTKINTTQTKVDGYSMKYLNNSSYDVLSTDTNTMVTPDGIFYTIMNIKDDCTLGPEGVKACYTLRADANGPKEPNIVGVDIYGFYVTKTQVIPFGAEKTPDDENGCSSTKKGWNCTAKVLAENKITW